MPHMGDYGGKPKTKAVLAAGLKKHAPKMRVLLDYTEGDYGPDSDYHSKEAKRLKAQIGDMDKRFSGMTPDMSMKMMSKAHKAEMVRLKARLAEHEAMCEGEE